MIETARRGGWVGTVEQAIDPTWDRPRSIDVVLRRAMRREAAVVEVWDLLDDIGAAFRGLDAKTMQLARSETSHVSALMVVRGMRRNRRLVHEVRSVFRGQFMASSVAWLTALTDPEREMPPAAGLLWTDVAGSRLLVARL